MLFFNLYLVFFKNESSDFNFFPTVCSQMNAIVSATAIDLLLPNVSRQTPSIVNVCIQIFSDAGFKFIMAQGDL